MHLKKTPKKFGHIKKTPYLCTVETRHPLTNNLNTLPCGVMVARRILVPPVRVRILPRQQKIAMFPEHCDFFVFLSGLSRNSPTRTM